MDYTRSFLCVSAGVSVLLVLVTSLLLGQTSAMVEVLDGKQCGLNSVIHFRATCFCRMGYTIKMGHPYYRFSFAGEEQLTNLGDIL